MSLYPHQKVGQSFLRAHRAAILADEMGLGKTRQVIAALNPEGKSALVICPAIARRNWQDEFAKVSGVSAHIIETKRDISKWDRHSHLITSYNFAHSLLQFIRERTRGIVPIFQAVIPDEGHFLKNPQAKRTKYILGKGGLCHYSSRIWVLTGTPMPNHAGELWTLLYTLGATKLRYHAFVKKFCNCFGGFNPKTKNYDPFVITGTKRESMPELREILKPVMLRRLTKDVINLPPLRFGHVYLEKPKNLERDLLTDLDLEKLKEEQNQLGGEITLEKLSYLAPSVSTLRRYTGLQKVSSLAALFDEELRLEAYPKIVIFAIHRDVIEGLRRRLSSWSPYVITGATTSKDRDRQLELFNKPLGTGRIMLANILAAGTAINLQVSNQVFFAEQDWVVGNNAQALKRCHRIGQDKSVFVRTASLENSLDDRINQLLKRKTQEICEVMDRGENV